ncbi:MAG: NUDIX hydrolase [Vicinamibacteria bacterium]
MSPGHPQVGVGGVVLSDQRVLLIRRGKQPLVGRWSIPGGTVEWGETLEQALVREMAEETGLEVEPQELLTVFDWIEREGDRVVFHYVIADYLCRCLSGTARAGSDALEVRWVGPEELEQLDLTAKALEVVREAFRRGLALEGQEE